MLGRDTFGFPGIAERSFSTNRHVATATSAASLLASWRKYILCVGDDNSSSRMCFDSASDEGLYNTKVYKGLYTNSLSTLNVHANIDTYFRVTENRVFSFAINIIITMYNYKVLRLNLGKFLHIYNSFNYLH